MYTEFENLYLKRQANTRLSVRNPGLLCVELCPPKPYVELLILTISEYCFIRRQSLYKDNPVIINVVIRVDFNPT